MKMKHLLILVFLLPVLSGFSHYGNELDKQIAEVKEASYYDSARLFGKGEDAIKQAIALSKNGAVAEVHLYYGNYFVYVRNLNKAEKYYQTSLQEAIKWNNPRIEMLSKIRLSFLKYEKGDQDQALVELNDLLDESKQKNDFENVAELLNLTGIIREDHNEPQNAAKLYLEGVTVSEIHNLNYYPAVFRNNLGLIKLRLGQIKEALDDFEKGLSIAEKENSQRLASHIQMNMCLAYIADKKPEKAYPIFEKMIAYSRENNLPQELASNYINLASALSNAGKNAEAIAYIDSAIVILNQHHLETPLARAYLNKASVLLEMKNNTAVEQQLLQLEVLVKKNGNLEDLSSYYFMNYRLKSFQNNHKEALESYLNYSKLKDSMANQLNDKVIAELQQNQKIQKKEIELEKERSNSLLLEKSNQEERFFKWISIGAGLLVVILIFSFSYWRYSRKIKEKQQQFSQQLIQNIEEERLRISRDLHDDIGQSLSVIKSKIIQEKSTPKELTGNLEDELGRVIEQTREISRNLYPTNLEKIGLERAIAALMGNLQEATKLECSFEIAEAVGRLGINIQTHLFRIIQECTNNSIKHAGASALKISIVEKGGEFVLKYQDNGKGLKIKKQNLGIGLRSIQERALIIGGSVDIDDKTDRGFKLIIKFKNERS